MDSFIAIFNDLTHCGQVTPSQHWLRYWLVAWWHQSITWTNVDSSSIMPCDIHLRANSQEMPHPSITKITLKIISWNFIEIPQGLRGAPGARLTKAYDVTIQRYPNSHARIEDSKMHILLCMGSKFCVKFQRCPLKFHTKFWTRTPQNMHLMGC